MTEYFKDRVVQNPGRVVLTPVSGETNTYDMERAEGTVTEAGTPFNASTFNGIANAIHGYATCATAAGTAAKVATCSGFVLYAGASVTVRFNYANTSTSATLNVNGTGAYPIRALSAVGTAPVNFWKAREAVTFVYDGTYWLIVDGGRYSPPGRVWYGTCPTAAGGTGANPKIVTVEDGFTLTTGATIAVKFSNASGGLGYGRDLNVNGTGAVPINVRGMTGTMLYEPWAAGDVVLFVYDGTYWQMVSPVTSKRTDITARVSVSRTGGVTDSTVSVTSAYRTGNVVSASIRIDAGSAASAGANVITFTINIDGLWTGAISVPTYYGSTLMVASKAAGTNPTVTVRAISAVAAAAYSTFNMIFPIED